MVHEIRTLGLPALLSFRTVARLGGISAAAAHLGVAKSGVSRHVTQLEAHFGVRLLERGARSVRLTPVGQRLDERIRSILAEVRLLEDIAREESAGVSGQVTLTTTAEIGSLLATHFFPELRARHPGLSIVMRTDYAFEDMQDPGTDVAFRVGTFEDDRLVARKLGGFARWLVAAPQLVKDHAPASPAELADLPCLTFRVDRPGATWWFLRDGAKAEAVDVHGPIAVRNLGILLDLARAGQGFAYMPSFMLDESLGRGELVRCLPSYASPMNAVYLTFRPGARNVARIAAVIDTAEDCLPRLLEESPHP